MGTPNILAIIPARGGSKRLPGKNLKLLDNRPLIAYSILLAKSLEKVSDVVVASDDYTIATMFDTSNAVIPSEFCTDNATLSGALEWVTQRWLEVFGCSYDWVILLQPTCPLRIPFICNGWIDQVLNDPNSDGLLTVDKGSYKLGSVVKTIDNYFMPTYQPMTPKQNIKPMMRENGVFYMFRAENVLKGTPWNIHDKMIPVDTPPSQSEANVDTMRDWERMEWLYWTRGYDRMFRELEEELK